MVSRQKSMSSRTGIKASVGRSVTKYPGMRRPRVSNAMEQAAFTAEEAAQRRKTCRHAGHLEDRLLLGQGQLQKLWRDKGQLHGILGQTWLDAAAQLHELG